MRQLKLRKLDQIIKKRSVKERPILGICLGMQLLFNKSFEHHECEGLAILEGVITKLSQHSNIKLPHIGWNKIISAQTNNSTIDLIDNNAEVFQYFVHSFAL